MSKSGASSGLDIPQPNLSDREDEHNRFCLAGIARTSLRCGQLRRGLDICTGKALRGNKVGIVVDFFSIMGRRCKHQRKIYCDFWIFFLFLDATKRVC